MRRLKVELSSYKKPIRAFISLNKEGKLAYDIPEFTSSGTHSNMLTIRRYGKLLDSIIRMNADEVKELIKDKCKLYKILPSYKRKEKKGGLE